MKKPVCDMGLVYWYVHLALGIYNVSMSLHDVHFEMYNINVYYSSTLS